MLLRGASAEALAALLEKLEGALRGEADAARVGDDLFNVAGLLREEPGLRRVATDVSVDADAKQGLARQILEGKVDPVSLDVVGAAFGRRWTAARDLADTLEHLGEVAVVRSAGEDSGRLADELFLVSRTVKDLVAGSGIRVAYKKAPPAHVVTTSAPSSKYSTNPDGRRMVCSRERP